jgi:hypothetical protein
MHRNQFSVAAMVRSAWDATMFIVFRQETRPVTGNDRTDDRAPMLKIIAVEVLALTRVLRKDGRRRQVINTGDQDPYQQGRETRGDRRSRFCHRRGCCRRRVVGVRMKLSRPASTTIWNHIWPRPAPPQRVSSGRLTENWKTACLHHLEERWSEKRFGYGVEPWRRRRGKADRPLTPLPRGVFDGGPWP